jgi:glycerophosphoryl diester phosphodiesterase
VFFWFWSDRLAARFRRIAPDIPLKMNSRTAVQVRDHKARFDHQIVEHGPNDGSAEVIAACRAEGIRVMAAVFGTDSPEVRSRYQHAVDLGYDMINLDDPSSFLAFRAATRP